MNISAVNKTAPITTGKSNLLSASTVILPMPFHPKIYSMKNDPANNSANQPEIHFPIGVSSSCVYSFHQLSYNVSPKESVHYTKKFPDNGVVD
jgi:hypothetical protein